MSKIDDRLGSWRDTAPGSASLATTLHEPVGDNTNFAASSSVASHPEFAKPSGQPGWLPPIEACASDLKEATEAGDTARMPLLVKALAELALVECGAIRVGSRRVQQALRVGRLSLARRLITLHLSQAALSPAMVAKMLGVSVRYLHVVFEATGKSFWQTVTAERVSLARRMLHETPQRPITDIAQACGFLSLATFYRVFGTLEGRTPGAFRGNGASGAPAVLGTPGSTHLTEK